MQESDMCTFDADKCGVLDLAELAEGDARVIGRLLDVFEDEDVAADGDTVLRLQVLEALAPLDERHRRAARHAGDVERRAGLHLVDRLERHRKVRSHSTHCPPMKKLNRFVSFKQVKQCYVPRTCKVETFDISIPSEFSATHSYLPWSSSSLLLI